MKVFWRPCCTLNVGGREYQHNDPVDDWDEATLAKYEHCVRDFPDDSAPAADEEE